VDDLRKADSIDTSLGYGINQKDKSISFTLSVKHLCASTLRHARYLALLVQDPVLAWASRRVASIRDDEA
jgi:hypothetical protein